jgi:hypothetical protein
MDPFRKCGFGRFGKHKPGNTRSANVHGEWGIRRKSSGTPHRESVATMQKGGKSNDLQSKCHGPSNRLQPKKHSIKLTNPDFHPEKQ